MPCYLSRLGLTLILGAVTGASFAADPDVEGNEIAGIAPADTAPPGLPGPPGEPAAFVPKGSLEAGIGFHSLTAGYPNWNSQFVRGTYAPDAKNTWTGEMANMRQFDAKGVLFVLGNTHVINDDWYMSTALATSTGGFFLPRYRADLTINRKFLEPRNLVIGAGLSSIKAKDEHRDLALLINAAYYFEAPWVIEAGARINRSNPGRVIANYYNVAVTYGRDKERYISLRLAAGREGYQLVNDAGSALADFASHDALLTWREWVGRDWGFQLRVGAYKNPYYRRVGGEFSLFKDF